MGIEYTLRIKAASPVAVEAQLLRIAGAKTLSGAAGEIEYRRAPGNPDGKPDATARVEGTAIYFCDHGGFGREYLGQIVARLVGAFGTVEVEERE